MLIFLILGIALTIALAQLIVKKSSSKTRPLISIFLWLLIGFLGFKIYSGIMAPVKFNNEKKVRYAKVINNLKMIRDAQMAHKEVTGDFQKDPQKLIKFIDTAKFALTQTRNVVKQVNKGTEYSPIMVDVEERVVDTIGYKSVKESLFSDEKRKNYAAMFNVPDRDNEKFSIETGYVEKVQGVKAPVFLAKVNKEVVLTGMDKQLIKQEKEQFGGAEVSGEFISVGSLDDVKTAGNWPPIYDTAEEQKKNKEDN